MEGGESKIERRHADLVGSRERGHAALNSDMDEGFCYEEDCTKEDPLSQESFRKLATSLPFSKQQNSKLVCYISKELMDTENPPLVLPNGYVYSTKNMHVPMSVCILLACLNINPLDDSKQCS
ncbi:hypothetical protein Taro_042542 [Colocasia esculenta]|uniref:RING-Gid-type domain-containing protein n=1 Tax=Colocasia esculenta TaxID=4460 RepID=A0A843WPV0_COLES|nr:hypothetical protein [Colocasia esculenta]